MNLLDPDIKSYVIKWEVTDIAYIDLEIDQFKILNQDGIDLGELRPGKGIFTKELFSVFDIDDNLVIKVAKKSRWKHVYYLTDSQGNEVAKTKLKGWWKRPIFLLNTNQDVMLTTKPDYSMKTGKINDTLDKIIAEYSTEIEETKMRFFKKLFKITSSLKILDEAYDKRFLLGFFFYVLTEILHKPDMGGEGGGGG